ncbi:ATP-binding protein [Paludibacterium yongneupense]|uniref:ATP-binding protein n=1 Tax=Paludibacterium yongneupense TaxID=400061 RepID=UPI000414AC5E|nr:ATP-binding protein [Paludibacterium yongneupense]
MTPERPSPDFLAFKRATRLLGLGGKILLLLLLALVASVLTLTFERSEATIHNRMLVEFEATHALIERLAVDSVSYLNRSALWLRTGPGTPVFTPRLRADGGDGGYLAVDLHDFDFLRDFSGRVWLRRADASSFDSLFPLIGRAITLNMLARNKYEGTSNFFPSFFFDGDGRFFASYKPPGHEVSLARMELMYQRIREYRLHHAPDPAIQWFLPFSQCDCLLAVKPVLSPQSDGYLVEMFPLEALRSLFPTTAAFALHDGNAIVYASPGFDRSIAVGATEEVRTREPVLVHSKGRLLLRQELHAMPWTLLYQPAQQGRPALESGIMLLHVLLAVVACALLLWGYRRLRQDLLSPAVSALLTLGRYQSRLAQTNTSLEKGRRLLQEVADLAPCGLYRVLLRDDQGEFTFVSHGFLRLLQLDAEAPPSLATLRARLTPDASDNRPLLRLLRGEVREVAVELPNETEPRWIEVKAVCQRLDDGVLQATGMWLDVSGERRRQQSLAAARDRAEQADRARALFLAMMSHEIRTPLNGLMAMLELLAQNGSLNEQQRHYLDLIESSGAILLHVISDILDFSRIQSGKVTLSPQPGDVVDLLLRATESARASIAVSGKPIRIELVVPQEELPRIWVDSLRLAQIVGNLLSNAVKFTEQGLIVVELSLTTAGAHAHVSIRVRDSGCGIARESLETLFSPFVQVDSTPARRHGGTGLGLAICQALATQMGGRIDVESEPGQGSCFTVELECPLAGEEVAPQDARLDEASIGARTGPVLVVEDHPLNRAVLESQLEMLGVAHEVVDSAGAALRRLDCGKPVALVLTDVSMPDVDGLELTRRIRANPATAAMPVVAISAHAFASDREQALAAGVDDYLVKPAMLESLRRVLRRWRLPDAPPQEAASPDEPMLAGLLHMFRGDRQRIAQVIVAFLRADADDLHALRQALGRGDGPMAKSIAHRMAGAARYVHEGYAAALRALEDGVGRPGAEARLERVESDSRELACACRRYLTADEAARGAGAASTDRRGRL